MSIVSKRFDQFIVIFNPFSTNSRSSLKRIRDLSKIYGKTNVQVINISSDYKKNTKILIENKEKLGPKTLLCIAAGDGTTSFIIDQLIKNHKLNSLQRKTPVLPLWGGNANDLGYMLNGISLKTNLKKLIKSSNLVKIHPLKVTIKQPDKKIIKSAVCYVSIGASAYAANMLNSSRHRKKTQNKSAPVVTAREVSEVTKAFFNSKRVLIGEKDRSDRKVFEYAMVNGSRIAKIERIPIKLTDDAFFEVVFTSKNPRILLQTLKVIRRKGFGRLVYDCVDFEVKQKAWAQIDGEVYRIPKNTKIHVQKSKSFFMALSTKLEN